MKLCLKCGSAMGIRQSGKTYFWRCKAYPGCQYMEIIPEHKKVDIETLKGSPINTVANSNYLEYEEELQLGEEQRSVYEFMESTDKNLFITGKAGTGKSVLLRHFVRHTSKQVIVLAPTGVAALNVHGQTLHSFFAFDHAALDPNDVWINIETAQILTNIDAFIIDEISMVRSDVMECINRKFQLAYKNNLPFGGVQLIAFGDLFQLEPVVPDNQVRRYLEQTFGGSYFFFAPAIQLCDLSTCELKHIFRQKDKHFQELLSDIRYGSPLKSTVDEFNTRTGITPPSKNILTIATTNKIVDAINNRRLSALPGKTYAYKAKLSGDLDECIEYTNRILKLKIGAQVMLLRNKWEKGKLIWANGNLAKVVRLSDNEIQVSINGKTRKVEPVVWETRKHKYNEKSGKIVTETVAKFKQFPLCLAWAMTMHKSQGKTFQYLIVDFGRGAFAHGQAYVALSRCESLNGLCLARPLRNSDIIVDSVVLAFMQATNVNCAN